MIEDIEAQAHLLIDSLTFEQQTTALAALRALDEGQAFAGPFGQLLGMRFVEFGDGRCTAQLEIQTHLLNTHGVAHGGVTFALADSACGGAAFSLLGQPRLVTQDMQIRYHGPVRSGLLEARAEVIYHGTRTMTTQCRLYQKDNLVGSVTATFAILSQEELAQMKTTLQKRPASTAPDE